MTTIKKKKEWRLWQKLLLASVGLFLMSIILTPLPSPLFNHPYTTTLRASNNALLSAAIASDQQWRFPPSDSIPFKFETAIRLYEDEYFNYHLGINPISINRAIWQNQKAGKIVSGGSTLTMQTIRMAYGNKPRTYVQKVLELFGAFKMELSYSKEEILKTYADNAPFGGNIVGISAASYRYFGRPPHLLSWAETTSLAVLPNNPSSVYPGKNEIQYLRKRDFLLNKLSKKGFLDADELFLAKQEPLPKKIQSLPDQASHLLFRQISEGARGTNIYSTLDAAIQMKASEMVNRHSNAWSGNQVHNAAAIIIDVASGIVLAYVGISKSSGENGQHVDIIFSK